MKVKKCDRCGAVVNGHFAGNLTLKHYIFFGYTDVDLCKECTNDLKKWFDLKLEVKESEDK